MANEWEAEIERLKAKASELYGAMNGDLLETMSREESEDAETIASAMAARLDYPDSWVNPDYAPKEVAVSDKMQDEYLAYLDTTLDSDEKPMSFATWKGTNIRHCPCGRGNIATSTGRCNYCSAPEPKTYAQSLREGAEFEYLVKREEEGLAMPIGWTNMSPQMIRVLAARLGFTYNR